MLSPAARSTPDRAGQSYPPLTAVPSDACSTVDPTLPPGYVVPVPRVTFEHCITKAVATITSLPSICGSGLGESREGVVHSTWAIWSAQVPSGTSPQPPSMPLPFVPSDVLIVRIYYPRLNCGQQRFTRGGWVISSISCTFLSMYTSSAASYYGEGFA